MKLLRPFTGTGAIFFPVGLPPKGTCHFATSNCLHSCYAIDPNDVNFDEELRIPEEEKNKIKDYMLDNDYFGVRTKIIADLYGLQTSILHWFGSGDCPPEMVKKVSAVIDCMPPKVAQMGFTRNKELWERHKDIFVLTIESKDEATDKNALYSIPNYKEQVSVMYSPSYQVRGGYCGPLTCRDINREKGELEHYINCKTCLRLKAGCFDRRM